MVMTPEISVLLPYRQCADTIEEAVDSILAQRGVALELIAIDDGSDDDGPARVAALAARHRQIATLASGGVGIVGALHAGWRAARGALIGRMDGDDLCAPERFAAQRELLAAEPALGAVGTRVRGFPDAALGQGMRRYIAWQNGIVSPAAHARAIFVEAPLCHPSVLLRRSALDAVGGWRETGGPEDYDLWLRLDAAGWAMAKVPELLFAWRHRAGRSTFSDPRYARERFVEAKAPHLARRLRTMARPFAVWGAGPTGKRLARALEGCALRASRFIDIDPRKIGRTARGAPVQAPAVLERGAETVVVAVGARGARDEIRARLDADGWREGDDYLCAA
ncbi:glycosyltransferase [Haliangium ochraceum]|uniref:Glycosyl transferase family 2 n=1 Tax=Haliangium ochraceum (strain DSM 14365 / JCM 11303 / SMP-2) TaxID=502025 RepID=D0LNS3_HALO1|nr:glycosyltransferase [Haliangium ochraceum]ACY16978.1 glycosyl transferase family 2 [Haliangium ochraceum DSM 14365]